MALDLFAVFFGGAIALLPLFAADILHVGPAGLGVLRTAPSVGALLVMLVATRRPPSRNAGPILLVSVAGFGVSMIVFGLSTTFALSLAALFVSGVTDGVSMVIRHVDRPGLLAGADPCPCRVGQLDLHRCLERAGCLRERRRRPTLRAVPSVVAGGLLTLGVVGFVAATVPALRRLDLDAVIPPDDDVPAPVGVAAGG